MTLNSLFSSFAVAMSENLPVVLNAFLAYRAENAALSDEAAVAGFTIVELKTIGKPSLRKRGKKRDPNRPKAAPTAWFNYMTEQREDAKAILSKYDENAEEIKELFFDAEGAFLEELYASFQEHLPKTSDDAPSVALVAKYVSRCWAQLTREEKDAYKSAPVEVAEAAAAPAPARKATRGRRASSKK